MFTSRGAVSPSHLAAGAGSSLTQAALTQADTSALGSGGRIWGWAWTPPCTARRHPAQNPLPRREPQLPHKRMPGVWLGARLAGPAGEVTLQFLRGHAEAPPQRSELRQPNSSPALPGNQGHDLPLPPRPCTSGHCPSLRNMAHTQSPPRPACMFTRLKSAGLTGAAEKVAGMVRLDPATQVPAVWHSLEHLSL